MPHHDRERSKVFAGLRGLAGLLTEKFRGEACGFLGLGWFFGRRLWTGPTSGDAITFSCVPILALGEAGRLNVGCGEPEPKEEWDEGGGSLERWK